jgi:ribosome-associated protein
LSWYNTQRREQRLEASQLAKKAVEAASEKQAADIILLDMRGVCNLADYFVICSGESSRQVQAIAEEIDKALLEDGVKPDRREGDMDSGWMLLDYGDVIIHIFDSAMREYYRLERLWGKATPLVRIL